MQTMSANNLHAVIDLINRAGSNINQGAMVEAIGLLTSAVELARLGLSKSQTGTANNRLPMPMVPQHSSVVPQNNNTSSSSRRPMMNSTMNEMMSTTSTVVQNNNATNEEPTTGQAVVALKRESHQVSNVQFAPLPISIDNSTSMESCLTVAVYNAALAHHLYAFRNNHMLSRRSQLLRKAMRLYMQAYRLERYQASRPCTLRFMLVLTNLTHVCLELGEEKQGDKVCSELLQAISFVSRMQPATLTNNSNVMKCISAILANALHHQIDRKQVKSAAAA